ncbi:hypothetical protein BDQ17DRAFT_1424379 [Cyathus striatus]|nr:hypothetical protein BDQ17DRAFT_1424379 [Cyathus striatus]
MNAVVCHPSHKQTVSNWIPVEGLEFEYSQSQHIGDMLDHTMYMLPDTEGPVEAPAALKHDQLLHIANTLILDNNLDHALNMPGIDAAAVGLEGESGGEHQIMNIIQPREREVSDEAATSDGNMAIGGICASPSSL